MDRRATDYEGVFAYDTADGERFGARWRDRAGRSREKLGFANKTQARNFKRDADSARHNKTPHAASERSTFAGFFARWWAANETRWATKTVDNYRNLYDSHVLPFFGPMRMTDIEPLDVQGFIGHLKTKPNGNNPKAKLSPATVASIVARASQVFEAAVPTVIAANPAAKAETGGHQSAEKRALAVDDADLLINAAPAPYRPLLTVLAFAGLRPGEAAGLTRADVDLATGVLRVHSQLVEVKGGLERREMTKTYRSRQVPLSGRAREAVRAALERPGTPKAPLFVAAYGGLIRGSNLRRVVRLARERAGLPEWVEPYTLRHTCATILARQGVPAHVAARFMGHDPVVFLRIYAHLFDTDLADAAKAIDEASPVVEERPRLRRLK